jgi:hypothetical protein
MPVFCHSLQESAFLVYCFEDSHNKRAAGFFVQRLGRASGGDGGESNSPSRRDCPEYATGVAGSLISPFELQPAESLRASRCFFRLPYRCRVGGTPIFRHPCRARWGEARRMRWLYLAGENEFTFANYVLPPGFVSLAASSTCNSVTNLPCRNHASPGY